MEEEYYSQKAGMEQLYVKLIVVLFKKLIGLFGDDLYSKLKTREEKSRDYLIDLYQQLTPLVNNISSIIDAINILLKDEERFLEAEKNIGNVLDDTRKILAIIALDLKKLAPEFEIMAQEAAPLIGNYLFEDSLIVARLGLLRRRGFKSENDESLRDYKARLLELKEMGQEAQKAIVEFIQGNYTWQTLHL